MKSQMGRALRLIKVGAWLLCLGGWWLTACRPAAPATVGPTAAVSVPSAQPETAAPPAATPTVTPTPEPLAARVNGAGILLAALQQEVARCQAGRASVGVETEACPDSALQNLIEQAVVEQAATAANLTVTDEEAAAAEEAIRQSLGSPEAYAAWLSTNLYTADEFRQALRQDRLRAKMAAQIAATVGPQAEQVHALALVVADETTAQNLLAQLRAGADFASLALENSLDMGSRAAGGDLGWFPRGVLAAPEVEAAVFALSPGETSDVIASAAGYHIVKVLEIDPARPLSPAAQQALQAHAYQTWLDEALASAVIEKIVSP